MAPVRAACIAAGSLSLTAVAAASTSAEAEIAAFRAEARHPQDGPHVDLRYRLEATEFVTEISMNLVFLDWMIEAPREDAERIDPAELGAIAPRIEAYCRAQLPVVIDGVTVAPAVRALAINDPDPVLLPLFPLSGWRGLRKISWELAYPLPNAAETPRSISVVWAAYPPDLLSILPSKPPIVIATEWSAGGLRTLFELTRDEPGYTWHRPDGGIAARLVSVPGPPTPRPLVPAWATLSIAVFAVAFGAAAAARRGPKVALGSGLLAAAVVLVVRPSGPAFLAFGTRLPDAIDEASARETFESLQRNLYRAFDYETEGAVYDALAYSVSGELLEETYLGVRRSLVMEEEGGAMSRVVAVRPVATRLVSQGELAIEGADRDAGSRVAAFKVEATWQVDGRVTHWGHSHDRTNEYDGRFTVIATADGWRIHDAEVTRQERVDAAAPEPGAIEIPPEDAEL
ncbi:MAG: hypothetical protein GC172_14190 [Phycisphaera sp.]|nr:hypothetical protein [Phycisphaera sp.]